VGACIFDYRRQDGLPELPLTESSGINVFVSYGRKDAAEFVERLTCDLKNAGFAVWRDIDELRHPHPWDEQLGAAIKRCDVLVAILTPHAVRTGREQGSSQDESVCLDELAFARFSPPPTPIVPLLLVACEPPFVIFRLNYLDFRKAQADEASYRAAFDALVVAIKAIKDGTAPAFRNLKFEPMDFDIYLRAKTRDFVGREWLTGEVLDRLKVPNAPRTMLLVGDPGWGKTAFAGRLFSANPNGQLLAAHFCRADRADSTDPRRFIESLAAMTAMRIPDFELRVRGLAGQHDELLRKAPVKDAFEQLFLEPLASLNVELLGELPRYILVDGLDEALAGSHTLSIPALLAQTADMFPDWLRLVATSRDKSAVLDLFGDAELLKLDCCDARNKNDIQQLILHTLGERSEAESANVQEADGLVNVIAARAEGNALCAAQLSLAVRRSGMDAAAINALPRGLSALYRAILHRRIDPRGSEWPVTRDVLEMILATSEAIPIGLVARACGDRAEYTTRHAIESIEDLLNLHNDAIRLFHLTLAEFLSQRDTPYFVNAAQGAGKLAGLTLDGERRAELSKPIVEFCAKNLVHWLVQCDDLKPHSAKLAAFYDEVIFSGPARPVFYYVNGVEIEAPAEKLISRLAAAGQAQAVMDVIARAFSRADDRFKNSGALPWISNGHLPAPEEELKITIGREIGEFFRATCIALGWMRSLAKAEPKLKPVLRQMLSQQGKLHWALGWIDIGVGGHTLKLSGFFEDQAFAIIADWGEIEKELS